MEPSITTLIPVRIGDHTPYFDDEKEPRNYDSVLGLARPAPFVVRRSRIAIAEIEAELSLRLAFLPSLIDITSPLDSASDLANRQDSIRLQESTLRREAELAKQPHKAIIALSELHQMYDHLIENRQHNNETSDFHNARRSSSRQPTNHSINNGNASFQGVLEFILRQASQEERTKLDLSCRLLGHDRIPESFGCLNFSFLVFLDLSKNQLKELRNESIKQLCNLETLDLQSNQLTELPQTIGSLRKLRTLNLSNNMLTTLHDNLGRCRSLQELFVAFNQLQSLPPTIGYGLTSLRIFSLHSNKLLFLSPSICSLVHLKVLDLHFNKLQSLPTHIGNLKSLEKLNLSNNFSDFGGDLPESLGDLACLTSLDLSYNQIRMLPDSIGALSRLRVLKVDNNPLIVPPKQLMEQSVEAVLEYMKERWIGSQSCGQETSTLSSVKQFKRSKSSHLNTTTSWLTSLRSSNSCKSIKCVASASSIIKVRRPQKALKLHES